MTSTTSPTDAELHEAIKALYHETQWQTVGASKKTIAKVIESLRASNPSWTGIDTKRVRTTFQEIKSFAMAKVVDSPNHNPAPTESSQEIKSSAMAKVVDSPNHNPAPAESSLRKRISKINTVFVPLSNLGYTSCKNKKPQCLDDLGTISQASNERGHNRGLPHLKLSSDLEEAIAGTKGDLDAYIFTTYKFFYAEWNAFLGPDPQEPMPPVGNFIEDMEAMQFLMLYPTGRGHYKGPFVQDAFHRYVVMRVQDPRWQNHAMWLQWALTLVADPEISAMINLILVTFHGFKARHVGQGNVIGKPIRDEFVRMKLNKDGNMLVPLTCSE